ncbi:discoidin domain-containing protein [Paenibacillus sp. Soil787]|uniref:discoidin domain-containing protein n=1 Tax=Paenibacillus sp. Soil787 TaxID=1736411 RepID=UPI000701F71B|nr:discoidin domain-containing protein [Paenibacillus sp. Soil787]KRF43828.1 hypothetical protein ASG93_02615 [Paenibacillus sp. Soil787]
MRKSKVFSLLMALFLVSTSFIAYSGEIHAAVQSTLYVSPAGSGTDCTFASPCSLQTAQTQVRAVNQNMTGDIIVYFLGGTYTLSSTFQLNESATIHDSGTNGFNIIYQAFPGAHPVFSGGKQLTGWSQYDAGKNIWRSYVGQSTGILQMYVNGVRAYVARGENKLSGFSINGTQYMTLDAFNVHNGSTSTMVNNTDTGITYSGSWSLSNGRNSYGVTDYNNDIQYTSAKSAFAQYTFTGTGIDVLAETDPAHSNAVQVYIDGVLDQTVSETTSTRLGQQTIYSKTGLSAGSHTIKIIYPAGDLTNTNSNYNMSTWGNPSQIRLVGLHSAAYFGCPVSSISGSSITMQQPCWQNARNPHYGITGIDWVENAYELLSSPGQFYYNITDGYMYYIPRSYENLSTATVVVPQVEQLVSGSGALGMPLHNLKFIGLTFEYGTWLAPMSSNGVSGGQGDFYYNENASSITNGSYNEFWQTMMKITGNVSFSNANNIIVQGNVFRHMGGTGLVLENASQNNTVIGNSFSDISAGGIEIGDVNDYANTSSSMQSKNNTVQDNYIINTGVQYPQTTAIFAGYNTNLQVLHNEIDNAPYSGISVGWGWGMESSTPYSNSNNISYNKITNSLFRLTEGGAIYTLGYQPDSIMSNNYLKNIFDVFGSIGLDNGTNFYTVSNNVIQNVKTYWIGANCCAGYNAMNNTVKDNFTDKSNSSIANAYGNSLTNTTLVTNGNWPTAAMSIMNNAGLEDEYQYLKNKAGVTADDTDPGITYSGSWTSDLNRRQNGPFDYQNSAHYTSTSGDSLTYLFVGTGIDVIAETNSTYSNNAQVYIDGVLQQTTLNELSSSLFSQQTVLSVSGLTPSLHEIKIVNGTNNKLTLDAFKVYGSVVPISQGKLSTASSNYSNEYDSSKAVDGDTTTRWGQASGDTTPWVKVDLGAVYKISSVNTNFYWISGLGVKYKIEYSTDDITYFMYSDKTAAYATQTSNTDKNAGSITARYMRITETDTQSQGGGIYQFDVYGSPVSPVSLVNLALNKNTTVSNYYQNNSAYNGAKAVDGVGTTRWATDASTTSATLEVDLGSITTFNKVVFKEDKDYGNRITGYKIQYWDGSSWLDAYTGGTPAAIETVTFPSVNASKVRLNITNGMNGPTIWEFEVY